MKQKPKCQRTIKQVSKRRNIQAPTMKHNQKKYVYKQCLFLNIPYIAHLEVWLVEVIFCLSGEHILHVECMSQTILLVSWLDPTHEAKILMSGQPYYQKDVAKIIMNLADCHRQYQAQSSEKGLPQRPVPSKFQKGGTQQVPEAALEAGTQQTLYIAQS
uniref:KH-like RNA-binding domain-containing protein n=1 Tax=Loxodonta africana TaxID=9785 RepID=G3U5J0_LOXAF